MDTLLVAVSGLEFGCADSAKQDVDLSFLKEGVDYTLTVAQKTKAETKPIITSISISAINFANLQTSVIRGNNKCTGITGSISGSSSKDLAMGEKMCLADDSIESASVATYTGAGSIGTLNAAWSNTSSGASGVETLKIWIKSAGQEKVRAI